jgi:hypothetical protein
MPVMSSGDKISVVVKISQERTEDMAVELLTYHSSLLKGKRDGQCHLQLSEMS